VIAIPYAGATRDVFNALIQYSAPISWMMVGGRLQRM
jgi:hypothetical protein